MALGKRLINTGAAAAAACTTDSTDPFGDLSGVALYSLDYDASDASGSYDGTPTDVTFGVGGQINYGARFNGSSSRISLPSGSFQYTILSVSAWINVSNTSSTRTIIETYGYSGSSKGWLLRVISGKLQFDGYNGDPASTTLTSNESIPLNTWTHVAVVFSANTTGKLYINGSEVTYATQTVGTVGYISNEAVNIGSLQGTGVAAQDYFIGSIDQVRIFNRALNSTEVGTLYAETACVYTATTTDNNYPTTNAAYYKLDNSAEDEKGSYDGAETDIEYRFGRYGQAAVFNGSSSLMTITDGGIGASGTARVSFSVSLWIKTTASNQSAIISDFGTNYSFYIQMESSASGGAGKLSIANFYTGGLVYTTAGTAAINDGNWHNLVLVNKTSDNTQKLYLDGNTTPVISQTLSTGTKTANAIQVGYYDGYVGTYNFDGNIDQVRLFSSALTSSQVTELYNEKPEVDTSNFKAVLYEGNSGTNFISNVGMDLETSGGLVWLKGRDGNRNHRLFDSVRGATKGISSSLTNQEFTESGLDSFEKSGFFLGSVAGNNANNESFVAWNWKAGGDAVNIGVNSITGSTPSIASDVSANTAAGFSVVKVTNHNNTQTIAHGLSQAPEVIFQKTTNSSSYGWYVYHKDVGNDKYLQLNTTAAAVSDNFWDYTTPTDTVFTHRFSTSSFNMIFYCWHSVAGYSKIGTYEGDGTNDYSKEITGLGFDPSFVMVKNVDSSGSNWEIIDSRRGDEKNLYANANYYENANDPSSYGSGKFITDGFEVARGSTSSSVHWNKSGDTYIYMAFK